MRSAGADSRGYLQSEHKVEESKGAAVMGRRGRWVLGAGGGGDMGAGWGKLRSDKGRLQGTANTTKFNFHLHSKLGVIKMYSNYPKITALQKLKI